MKNNTAMARKLLEQAVRAIPQDNALEYARYYTRKALMEVSQVEKKRFRRAQTEAALAQQQESRDWSLDLSTGNVMSPYIAKLAVDKLDQMIGEEKEKLKKIQDKSDDNKNVGPILG